MTEMTLQEVGEEVTAVTPAAPIQKMHILICYVASDVKHLGDLDRHLQLMYRRLGPLVKRHYFCYEQVPEAPKPYTGDYPSLKEKYQQEKEAYEKQLEDYNRRCTAMLQFLQQDRLLIILYVSNALMEHLWKDMEDSNLNRLLTTSSHRIAPVLITPTAGFASNCEPLCAYEGVAHDVACQHITETIETVARDYFGEDLVAEASNPFALLTSPSTVHVSVPSKTDRTERLLAGLQAVLEQTHTRVVESQQLAIAERSSLQESEDALRREVEGMKQQITTLQTWQNASLAAKLRRLFSH
jgi:hypothetical protein